MSDLICPRCEMRLVRGEVSCIHCSYKLPAKLRRQNSNETLANSETNIAIKEFDLSEYKRERGERRRILRKVWLWLFYMILAPTIGLGIWALIVTR